MFVGFTCGKALTINSISLIDTGISGYLFLLEGALVIFVFQVIFTFYISYQIYWYKIL